MHQLSAARWRKGVSGSRASEHVAAHLWISSRAAVKLGSFSSSGFSAESPVRCMLTTMLRCSSGNGNMPIAAMASGAKVENRRERPSI
jgi:hypothetical protein